MALELREAIRVTHQHFGEIFIGGVPRLLNSNGAYLSFISVFAGTEALAGFRYPSVKSNGERFRSFVIEYFEPRYQPFAEQLWGLRNSMVHSFSPRHFRLTHHNSLLHFAAAPPAVAILNAEDVYAAFVTASEKYFLHLNSDSSLQALFEQRLSDPDGGGISVRI
jgi:hypothetical protein